MLFFDGLRTRVKNFKVMEIPEIFYWFYIFNMASVQDAANYYTK